MKSDDKPLAKEIIQLLLKSAKLQSMKEIYGRISPGDDGRIRTSLNPAGTDTGRFSSRETFLETSTNLQNIPKKTAKADPLFDVRRVLVPDDGYVLIEADLSQAEARVTSAYAGDKRTLALFDSGADIHSLTAAKIFKCEPESITAQQRHLGKMARHALNYGMGWKKFHAAVNKDADLTGVAISPALAKKIVTAYHKDNPQLLKWWKAVERQVKEKGFLTNPYGRKRIFIDKSNVNAMIAYLPQSTIADHLNAVLVEVFEKLDGPNFVTLLQIHDAVLGQSPVAKHLVSARALKKLMTKPITINGIETKIPADVSISRESWGEMKGLNV